MADADLEMAFDFDGVSYHLWGRMSNTGPLLTSVEITAPPDGFLYGVHLRAPLISTFATAFELGEGEIERVPIRQGRPRRPEAAGNRLSEVAEVVRGAAFGSRGRAVAEHFGVSQSYARQLVARAAAAGYQTWR
jgi:hypothetical protein